MKEFFANNWVSGIICSIIGGIVLYFLNNVISNRKYNEQLNYANKKVLEIVKQNVAENGLFEVPYLKYIISSVAREYDVLIRDMQSINAFYEDLFKEITINPYLDNEMKMQYFEKINSILTSTKSTNIEIVFTENVKNTDLKIKRSNLYIFASILTSSCMILIIYICIRYIFVNQNFLQYVDSFITFGVLLIILTTFIFSYMAYNFVRSNIHKHIRNDQDKRS